MTGSVWTVKTIFATGDARIDGILRPLAWNDATVYYSVPQTSTEYGNFYGNGEQGGHFAVTNAMGTVADFAMAKYGTADDGFSIEGFTNLDV
ncbi:MAG: serralysin [Paracoccaceae bacterium]|jgi:serralysin